VTTKDFIFMMFSIEVKLYTFSLAEGIATKCKLFLLIHCKYDNAITYFFNYRSKLIFCLGWNLTELMHY